MGLDMYLYKKSYVQIWEHTPEEKRHQINVGANPTGIKPERISYIVEQVAYWRKFNALHSYIVQTFANGEDNNCQEISVDINKILLHLKEVNKENAELTLPTQSGFFFGGTEYDEYYWDELADAIKTFEELTKENNSVADYIYQASW